MNAEKNIAQIFKEYTIDSLRMSQLADLMDKYYWTGAGLGALVMFFLCLLIYGLLLH